MVSSPPATALPASGGRRVGAAVIAARCRSTAWSLSRLAGLVCQSASESFGSGKPATGVSGGSAPAHAAASGCDTTRSGSGVAGFTDVVSDRVPAARVFTQSAAAG